MTQSAGQFEIPPQGGATKSYSLPLRSGVAVVDVGDSNVIPTRCSLGHDFLALAQAYKFQVLFEYAMLAYADGYHREAVSSAATALERAFEFYIHMVTTLQIGPENFKSVWKTMNSQSERQLGAFIALYTLLEGELPPQLDGRERTDLGGRNAAHFRNIAIHRGYIPKKEEAFAYLDFVLGYIRTILERLEPRLSDYYQLPEGPFQYDQSELDKYPGWEHQPFTLMALATEFRVRQGTLHEEYRGLEETIEFAVKMQVGMRELVASAQQKFRGA